MSSVRVEDVVVIRGDADTVQPIEGPFKGRPKPIIVREDMVLVDGLRRLWWHKDQGRLEIPVIVVTTFEEALEALAEQHLDRAKISASRLWEVIEVLRGYARTWTRGKWNGGWIKDEGSNTNVRRPPKNPHGRSSKNPIHSIRGETLKAFGLNEHIYQATNFLYSRAVDGDVRAKGLTAQVSSGQISVTQAWNQYRKPNNLVGSVTNPEEQQRILQRAMEGLHAQLGVLQKIGHPLQVSDEDLANAIRELGALRRQLGTVHNSLRRIQKENNG